MAPVISLPETYALAENIADHHKLFSYSFPNRHLSPKDAFLHYTIPGLFGNLGLQLILPSDHLNGFGLKKAQRVETEEYLSNFERQKLSVVEKEELGIGQIKKILKKKIIKYQGTEDSSVEFLQKQQ
ncbi:hypothetical protein TNCV_626931 [Trichonephila clavipes]|nr:hypothetical protein TNCV_626931 [Trichonephila clavipes]